MNAHPRLFPVVFVAQLITSAVLHRVVHSARASLSQDYRPPAATPVIGGRWAASEERIIRFMAAILPAVDRCL